MVSSAATRIEKLLEATGGDGECPECGGPEDPDKDSYELRWLDPGEADPVETWCETCRRQTTIVVTWDGLPRDPG